jgi:hypothetical protein
MPPENDGEQEVDRGDNFEPTEPTGEVKEPAAETKPDLEGAADLDIGDAGDDKEGGDAGEGDDAAEAAAGDDAAQAAAAGADEGGDAGRDAKTGQFIPKDRFDEAVGRERAEKERLGTRLQELENREADRSISADMEAASAKITVLIGEHTKLISDGDLDGASAKMGDIIALQGDMQAARSQAIAAQSSSQTKNEMQYDAVVGRLELEYPEINPEDIENFDKEAVRKVQAYMTGLISMDKMSPSAALQESVATILGAKRAAEAEENQTEEEKEAAATAAGLRRKEVAVGKALDAQGKQPADLQDVGKDHDKEGGTLDAAAVMKMKWEDFIKLPEEELSKMRGDTLG